jgi:hypothetical protein
VVGRSATRIAGLVMYGAKNYPNYWVFGLFPSSGILGNGKHDVSETGFVSVLGWSGKTPIHLDPLDTANLNHWTMVAFSIS